MNGQSKLDGLPESEQSRIGLNGLLPNINGPFTFCFTIMPWIVRFCRFESSTLTHDRPLLARWTVHCHLNSKNGNEYSILSVKGTIVILIATKIPPEKSTEF